MLDAGGYKAVVSGCAKRSLILLKDWKPDVVLLDMALPDCGSLFVLDQIKQDPQMQHARIMVLSKPGDTQAAQEAMQLGVHEVMLKPIDHDMLLFKMGHLQALQKERGTSAPRTEFQPRHLSAVQAIDLSVRFHHLGRYP